MGFSSDAELMAFRMRCNQTSLSLRKNQYAQLLAGEKVRLEDLKATLLARVEDADLLEHQDLYGQEAVDARRAEEEARTRKSMTREEAERAEERTTRRAVRQARREASELLRRMGVVDRSIDELATLRQARSFEGNLDEGLDQVAQAKASLDQAKEAMYSHRSSIQSIIDGLAQAERTAAELEAQNESISRKVLATGDRQARNRLLLQRLENRQRVEELRQVAETGRTAHLSDFSALERLRDEVDRRQAEYDRAREEFRSQIGSTKEQGDQLALAICRHFHEQEKAQREMREQGVAACP